MNSRNLKNLFCFINILLYVSVYLFIPVLTAFFKPISVIVTACRFISLRWPDKVEILKHEFFIWSYCFIALFQTLWWLFWINDITYAMICIWHNIKIVCLCPFIMYVTHNFLLGGEIFSYFQFSTHKFLGRNLGVTMFGGNACLIKGS